MRSTAIVYIKYTYLHRAKQRQHKARPALRHVGHLRPMRQGGGRHSLEPTAGRAVPAVGLGA